MGPTTLDLPKPSLDFSFFRVVAFLIGITILGGLEWIKRVTAKQIWSENKETGGDLFAIDVEENHYPTDDFMDMAEIVRDEIDNGDRPAIVTPLENLDDYDVIFVGYPIWLAYHKLIQCTQIA